jgi:hypothetical protein
VWIGPALPIAISRSPSMATQAHPSGQRARAASWATLSDEAHKTLDDFEVRIV